MRTRFMTNGATNDRGISLVEVLIALVVLSVGIMAISSVFPTGTRTQIQNRNLSNASYYALQKLEELRSMNWSDAALSVGRHPPGTAYDTLGTSKAWLRYYQVNAMASPLDDLKQVIVKVSWTYNGTRSVTDTAFVRR